MTNLISLIPSSESEIDRSTGSGEPFITVIVKCRIDVSSVWDALFEDALPLGASTMPSYYISAFVQMFLKVQEPVKYRIKEGISRVIFLD